MAKDFDIEKLKGSDNYHTWSFAIQNVLAIKGLEKCLTGEETKDEKKTTCKAILSLSVETSIYVHIQKCETAVKIWDTLKNLYEDKGLSRKIGLLRYMISCRLEDCENMQQYVDKIVCASNKLTGIGFPMSNEWLGAILLAGLTESYRPFIMGIEASDGDIASDKIISKLLDSQSNDRTKGEALMGKKKFKKKNNFGNKKCFNCGSKKHLANKCDKKRENDDTGKAKVAFSATFTGNQQNVWYVDSGASSHMTPHAKLLKDMKSVNVSHIVSANNAKMMVKSAGNAILNLNKTEIEVADVLHVPELAANLLSVCSIVEKGNSMLFDANGCTIKNDKNEIVATCKPKNGVYKFHGADGVCLLSKEKTSALTWHRRLGHINFQSMKKMRDGAVDGINFADDDTEIKKCETCAYGKQHRQPFKSSETQTSNILEIIHSDLMGPMETQSIGHARYILTFIDDFSKKVFTFYLKSKSEALHKFMDFKIYVENQTERKIKIFRTDNGGEYCSSDFDDFCKRNGIQHQLTVAYTPQQNGVAERMNRTLVERAKCLLYDADLPKCFWGEAINMATYLINRSVCASHGKTPDEIFYGAKVDLSNLRIFGSSVMVHVPKEKRRKWDKKSERLIFVGYDSDTKAYRCINRDTRKLTVSRDVIFHENIPEKRFECGFEVDADNEEQNNGDPVSENENDGDGSEENSEPNEDNFEERSTSPDNFENSERLSETTVPGVINLDESKYDTPDDEDDTSIEDVNESIYVPNRRIGPAERSPIVTRN